jgi:hypothetical protein
VVTIDIRHKVDDFAEWKRAFDAAAPIRHTAGEIACRIYTVHGSENDVVVSVDWDTLEHAREFLASPRLHEGMAKAGVLELPHMLILEPRDAYKP